ncbi:MAG: dipeptide ABC transporter ATP-binding protein [Pseudomonadota bacterium]
MTEAILEARDLVQHFHVGRGLFSKATKVRAVDGVSLSIRRGETFAIVGESGCGKSTLARLLMRLLEPTAGSVRFEDQEISTLSGKSLADLRRDMQFIFQDPFSSLNPRMSVGRIVGEPLETHSPELDAAGRRSRVAELLDLVGLRSEHASRYPHEFSGGQRQRIGIARALASGPKLLIGDEPVSALDVSVQAQVVNLLEDLKRELDLTLVIIAHDLAVIRHMSDRVAVMYLGQIVESGPADTIFAEPRHPYTLALLAAVPEPVPGRARNHAELTGEMPSPSNPPSGCRFHTRCPYAREACGAQVPELRSVDDEHEVACHYWEDIAASRRPFQPSQSDTRSPAVERRFELYRTASFKTKTASKAASNDARRKEPS